MRRILVLAALLYCCGISSILLADEYLIAFAKSGNIAQYDDAIEGFKGALQKKGLGFKLIEYNIESEMSAQMNESGKPDIFLTVGSKATAVIKNKVKDIPVVFCMIISQSFSETNMTGVLINIPPIAEFKVLKKLLPKSKKIGVLYDPKKTKGLVEKGIAQARELGMEIVSVEVSSMQDVYGAVRTIGKVVDVLWMIPDSTIYSSKAVEDILLYSLREKMPVIGISPNYVKAGALFSISCNYKDIGRQGGDIAAMILQGEKPANIKVAEPEKTVISINLITADRIGLIIPDEFIREAENVYK